MSDCTCPSIRCEIHGEPIREPVEIELPEGLEIPQFIKDIRSKSDEQDNQ